MGDIIIGTLLIVFVVMLFGIKIHHLIKQYGYTDISEMIK